MLYYFIDTHKCISARVAEELHEDGSPHVHVYCCGAAPYRTKNEKLFDTYGFHPNIQPCRKVGDVLTYIAKGGNYIDYGELDAGSTKRTWNDLLLAENALEAKTFCKEHFARDYVLNHEKLEYFINKHFKKEIPQYTPTAGLLFNPNPIMSDFANQRLDVISAVPYPNPNPITQCFC